LPSSLFEEYGEKFLVSPFNLTMQLILDSSSLPANLLQDVSSPDPGLGTATARRGKKVFPHLGTAIPTTPSGYVKLTQRLELLQLRYPLPFP
jgi:hypothetical protein